jgi:putative transposase
MKGKRFSEEQIIRILHDAEALGNVRDVCRQHNIAEQTLYRWRRQFGGMAVSEAKRLRWAAAPRVGAPTRDGQRPTDPPEGKRPGLLVPPGGRHGSGWAKDAVAFVQIARASLNRAVSFRRRVRASDTGAAFPCFSGRSTRCDCPSQVGTVVSCTPRSRAVWALGCSDSTASRTARTLKAAGYCFVLGGLIAHTSSAV